MRRSEKKATRRIEERLNELTGGAIVIIGRPVGGLIQVADEGAGAVCNVLDLAAALRRADPADHWDPVCTPAYAAAWSAIRAAEA